MPEGMPERTPEDLPDRMLEDMPDRMPEGMPDRMPDKMSDRMPEDMPDKVRECLPDRMPEDLDPDWNAWASHTHTVCVWCSLCSLLESWSSCALPCLAQEVGLTRCQVVIGHRADGSGLASFGFVDTNSEGAGSCWNHCVGVIARVPAGGYDERPPRNIEVFTSPWDVDEAVANEATGGSEWVS